MSCVQLYACFYGRILSPKQNGLSHVLPFPYKSDALQLLDAIAADDAAAPTAAMLMRHGAELTGRQVASLASLHVHVRRLDAAGSG